LKICQANVSPASTLAVSPSVPAARVGRLRCWLEFRRTKREGGTRLAGQPPGRTALRFFEFFNNFLVNLNKDMKIETVTLSPVAGFSPEIGLFLASLYKIRHAWREAVKDLSKDELAAKILPDVQPIGTIIIHIAEAEYFWIQQIVEGKEFTEEIRNLLHHDLWFKDFAAHDLDIDYCLEVVEKIHHLTQKTLAKFTDDDLEKTFVRQVENGERHYSLRWIFIHLLEHDAEHKGQMLMIKRLLKAK
jgi:uncharacterized damage-inducible protein DinB